ncbi:MAG TPA: hypothetical protein VK760_07185, partial [Candidatus Acidoferrales bacterium]|nr:hypothetical protein [Candidatus Acidoferrales bacterium]
VAASGAQLFFESGGGQGCTGTQGACVNPTILVTDYATSNVNSTVTQTCSTDIFSMFNFDANGAEPEAFFHMAAAGGQVYLIEDSPYLADPQETGKPNNPKLTDTNVATLYVVPPCSWSAAYEHVFAESMVVGVTGPDSKEPTSIAADPQTQNASFGYIGLKGATVGLQSLTIQAIHNGTSTGVLFPAVIPDKHTTAGIAYGW